MGGVGGVGQNKHEKEKKKGLALCIHPTPSIYLILHYAKSFAVNENSEISFVMLYGDFCVQKSEF